LNGAKHISFSNENCEKLKCFAPSKTGTWQQQKLCTIQNKILAMAKIGSTFKGVSIKYLNPV
jgi:hypothetical protein